MTFFIREHRSLKLEPRVTDQEVKNAERRINTLWVLAFSWDLLMEEIRRISPASSVTYMMSVSSFKAILSLTYETQNHWRKHWTDLLLSLYRCLFTHQQIRSKTIIYLKSCLCRVSFSSVLASNKTPEKTSVSLATWWTQWRDEKLTLNVVRCLADNVRQVLEVWTNKRTESELKE